MDGTKSVKFILEATVIRDDASPIVVKVVGHDAWALLSLLAYLASAEGQREFPVADFLRRAA